MQSIFWLKTLMKLSLSFIFKSDSLFSSAFWFIWNCWVCYRLWMFLMTFTLLSSDRLHSSVFFVLNYCRCSSRLSFWSIRERASKVIVSVMSNSHFNSTLNKSKWFTVDSTEGLSFSFYWLSGCCDSSSGPANLANWFRYLCILASKNSKSLTSSCCP